MMNNFEPVEGQPEALSDEWQEPEFNPDQLSGEAVVSDPGQNETESENDDQYFIKIDKRNLNDEVIQKILQESPEFRNHFNRNAGNRARERYFPRIEELQREAENLRRELRARDLASMPQEQVQERFKTDPNFAREYTELIHQQPQAQPQVNPAQEALNLIITDALDNGLQPEDLAQFKANLEGGKYEVDEFGTQLTASEWRIALRTMKRDIDGMVTARRTPVTNTNPPVETAPQQQVTRTDTASPDMSNPGNRGSQRHSYTLEQVRQMTPDRRLEIWPTEEAYERALSSGEILLPDDVRI